MRHCRADAPGRNRKRQYWRAAATRPHSDKPRPAWTRTATANRNPIARECLGALPPGQAASGSQRVVGTVAERLAAGRLAPAQPNLLGGHGGKRDWGQSRALVRSIAEGL